MCVLCFACMLCCFCWLCTHNRGLPFQQGPLWALTWEVLTSDICSKLQMGLTIVATPDSVDTSEPGQMQAAQSYRSYMASCRIWSPPTPPSSDETYTFHFLGSLLLCSPGESIAQHLIPLAQNLRGLGLAERCRQLFMTRGAVTGFTLSLSNRAFTPSGSTVLFSHVVGTF